MQSADRFTLEFYQKDNQRLRARVEELEETIRQLRVPGGARISVPKRGGMMDGWTKTILAIGAGCATVCSIGLILMIIGGLA